MNISNVVRCMFKCVSEMFQNVVIQKYNLIFKQHDEIRCTIEQVREKERTIQRTKRGEILSEYVVQSFPRVYHRFIFSFIL